MLDLPEYIASYKTVKSTYWVAYVRRPTLELAKKDMEAFKNWISNIVTDVRIIEIHVTIDEPTIKVIWREKCNNI